MIASNKIKKFNFSSVVSAYMYVSMWVWVSCNGTLCFVFSRCLIKTLFTPRPYII